MKCTAYSRAERSSPADGVSSCKQSPRLSLSSAAPLKNTTNTSCFFNAFLTHLRDFFLNRAWSLSSAFDAFSCKQSLIFACRLKYPAKLHAATACRFLCAFRTPLQKLCRRVRRLRSRLPLASNFSLFACRQQLYGLFCHRNLSAAVLFVWFFNLKISWIFL